MDNKINVYIAGAMSGEPDFNYAKFMTAANGLRLRGFHPVHTANQPRGLSYATYIGRCIELLGECEAVYVLSGSSKSKGVAIELVLAREANKPVFHTYKSLMSHFRMKEQSQ